MEHKNTSKKERFYYFLYKCSWFQFFLQLLHIYSFNRNSIVKIIPHIKYVMKIQELV